MLYDTYLDLHRFYRTLHTLFCTLFCFVCYICYNTHVTVVMLRLYRSLSPGLVSSGCSQVTVTLVSLSAVTLTSTGGLG